MPEPKTFLSLITGSFATPAAENPTVAMIEAAYEHHHINARYLNCEVAPDALGDAVRGARAMGWVGFNCSIPPSSARSIASYAVTIATSVRTPTDRDFSRPCARLLILWEKHSSCLVQAALRARSRWKRHSPGPLQLRL